MAGSTSTASVLEVRELVAGYGEVEVLHGVSLRVAEGEMVAVIGPNGAGKSTLMKAIVGLVPPRAGRVLLRGQDITGLPAEQVVARGVCYVPQADNVFPSLTVRENLEMGAYLVPKQARARMERAFALFPELAHRRHERAGRLSGGQRQMLALARALMLEPQVLLLDEPSAGLAPRMVELVFAKVREINATGTAVLMVEQNAREALKLAHRAYVLAMGQNRLEGAAQELLASPDVARVYLGE
ncbi:MAG TPA: ABC transporter ATP-binding protein [Dehalococcoidia bacterium]|nr:ABC transporter ATP-binding protein [Dehalococcoidia bacterium]